MGRRSLFGLSGILRAINRRPLNVCASCGYSWYPRGKNLSLKCPNCCSPTTHAGCAGCSSILLALAALAAISVMGLFCCGGLGALASLSNAGKPLPNTPIAKAAPAEQQKPRPSDAGDAPQANSVDSAPENSDPEPPIPDEMPEASTEEPPQPIENSSVPPEFAGELAQGNATLGPIREWTSADGKFHRKARYKSLGGKHIKLIREDGSEIDVERSRLSKADQDWLDAYLDWKHRGRKPPRHQASSTKGE